MYVQIWSVLMTWDVSHNAPRDRPIWLYLPCAAYTTNPGGYATSVSPGKVVAQWDVKRSAWIMRDPPHSQVFPSMWCDADVGGPKPDNPMIGQT